MELNAEEQKLMSFAYSKLEHALRASWRIVRTHEQDEDKKSDGGHAEMIAKCRAEIEQELEALCDEVIGLVKNNITLNATTDETRVFCLKMFEKGLLNGKRFIANSNTGPVTTIAILLNVPQGKDGPPGLKQLMKPTT